MPSNLARRYKIRLAGGRVLGPLELERVYKLIAKKKIVGDEQARVYPDGPWVNINQIDELANLLLARARGELTSIDPQALNDLVKEDEAPLGETVVLPSADGEAPDEEPQPTSASKQSIPSLSDLSAGSEKIELDDDKTEIHKSKVFRGPKTTSEDDDKTRPDLSTLIELKTRTGIQKGRQTLTDLFLPKKWQEKRNIAEERTVLFDRSATARHLPGKKKMRPAELIRATFIALAVGYFGYDAFLTTPDEGPVAPETITVRPKLPSLAADVRDPQKSEALYRKAMQHYIKDHVVGYIQAARYLIASASNDPDNVKAHAMLVSCYLNLIDSTAQDDRYFHVISKLIDISRANKVDLPETVIADVEFFTVSSQPEAAQSRIVEYTKTHESFGLEMFFYLSYAFFHRGDYENAARFIGQIPENRVYTPRIYYLRGQIAEAMNASREALAQYRKAVTKFPDHARSHLRLADLFISMGEPEASVNHLRSIMKEPRLLAPKDLAHAYFLQSQLLIATKSYEEALGSIEKAVHLDSSNHDYLLELFTLRGRYGDQSRENKQIAQMYYYLGKGEEELRNGRTQEALLQFMKARELKSDSILPLVKMGDMFMNLEDVPNARDTYRKAVKLKPDRIRLWSRYIVTLIETYDWQSAQRALGRLKSLPNSQSFAYKLTGDFYAKQGRHVEAQAYYRKALAREVIDKDVYLAYAKSLLESGRFKDAAFYYALARRYDPLNAEAIIGTAKSLAGSDSLDRAIQSLRDEINRNEKEREKLLGAIAELQIQKGDHKQAMKTIQQAKAADPEYAYPWLLEGRIHLNESRSNRNKLDDALYAFKAFSDRSPANPAGYLERYGIFMAKAQYEKASDELTKVHSVLPHYPNLYYLRGNLFFEMGNYAAAIKEYEKELGLNHNNLNAYMGLGRSYLEMRSYADALDAFSKSMQLGPSLPEPRHMSAYVHYLLGNYPASVALYKQALTYDKANPLLYKRLGMAYRELGSHAEAAQAFRKYLEMEPDAPDKAEFQKYL